jgi:Laminin B (Domain IV)
MTRHLGFLLGLAAAPMAANFSRADIVAESTFATSYENWTAGFGADRSVFATFNAADGNPAGSLRVADRPDFNFTWYFDSSDTTSTSPFFGDKSAAYGGTITYDLKRFVDPGLEYYTESSGALVYNVLLHGVRDLNMDGHPETTTTLGFASPLLTPALTGVWQSFSVPLLASAGWFLDSGFTVIDLPATEPEMMAVLTNLRRIEIRGNYSLAIGDNTGLDNVRLNTLPAGIPEPSAIAALSLVALLCGGLACCKSWLQNRQAAR